MIGVNLKGVRQVRYSLKHAFMLALGLTLGAGTMAFTDILHPTSAYIPSSLVLDTEQALPETMSWVDPRFGFHTSNPSGLLEIRWYCAYEGMSGFSAQELQRSLFHPAATISKPQAPQGADAEAFYYEVTRTQTDPCPVFRTSHDYP